MVFQIAAVILIKPLVVANRPKKTRDPTMFKDPYYVAYSVAAFLWTSGLFIPYFDCAIYFFAKFDKDLNSALYTLIIANAGDFVGRVVIPSLTDFGIGADHLLNLAGFAILGLGFVWIGVKTKAAYHAFLFLWGIFSGGMLSLPPCAMPNLCHWPEVFATRLGVMYGICGIGTLIGVPVAKALNKSSTDFLGDQLWIGCTAIIAIPLTIYSGIGARRNRKALEKTRHLAQQYELKA